MSRVAVLGLGAMGTRVLGRLLGAGHDVVAWSRSGVKPDVASHVTRVAESPADAAGDADVVVAMVRDDAASRSVWLGPSGALAATRPGALALELGTMTPTWIGELEAAARARDTRFLAAPVVGSRPQAEAGALVVLAGGEASAVEAAGSVLAHLGKVRHVGSAPQAALAKLVVNALFAVQVAALAELRASAAEGGLAHEALEALLAELPVTSPAARGALDAMNRGAWAPLFPVDLARKDLRYALEAARQDLPVTRAAAEVLARASEAGHGGEHLVAVAKLYA